MPVFAFNVKTINNQAALDLFLFVWYNRFR